jgi:hypothetical protein
MIRVPVFVPVLSSSSDLSPLQLTLTEAAKFELFGHWKATPKRLL